MSGSVTVIGGVSGHSLTGILTVPIAYLDLTVTGLQTTLSNLSSAVEANSEILTNASVIGGAVTTPGLLEITGSETLGGSVPGGYNALVVEATAAESIAGNGSSDFLAVFSSNSSVNFNTEGGSGTIYASGNDTLTANGSSWSVIGGSLGNVNINTAAAELYATLSGSGVGGGVPSNAIGSYADTLSVLSTGTSDFVLTGSGGDSISSDSVTVTGFANVRDIGAADTVYATGAGSFSGSFGAQGGSFVFINESSSASSIIGGISLTTGMITSPGSVTVEAGAGGGVYDGGTNGSNSLVGGSGLVTLFSAGTNNFLSVDGAATGSGYNLLNAASGSNDTLVAGSGSTNNVFFAGTGTESIVSDGSGVQTYFVGTLGAETITASTVSGATNAFVFNQAASQGGGSDVIKDFVPGSDYGVINNNDSITGVTISDITSLSGADTGTQIDLSNGTTIKIIGVDSTSFSQSLVGGTHF